MPLSAEIIEARIHTVKEHIQSENMHNLNAIMATFGSQAQYEDIPWGKKYTGHTAVQSFYMDLIQAVPDVQIDVQNWHISDKCIILEVVISGTHRGTWRGVPPTEQPLRFPLCGIYTFDEHNRLAGEKIYYDCATVLQQLGLFHNPNSLLGRLSTLICHPVTIVTASMRKLFRR